MPSAQEGLREHSLRRGQGLLGRLAVNRDATDTTGLAARLAQWAMRDVDDTTAALVMDELVTNAVVYAGTEIELLISARPGILRVAVVDRHRHRHRHPNG